MNDKQYLKFLNKMQKANNKTAQSNALDANRYQLKLQNDAQSFNAKQAMLDRNWQERMSGSVHQREMKDLEKAGLNPVLAANNGAPVSSGAAASSGIGSSVKAEQDMQAASLFAQRLMTKMNNATTIKATKMNNAISALLGKMNAAASMYSANAGVTAASISASAARDVAALNYQNAEKQRAWDAEHPNTPWSALFSVLAESGVTPAFISWLKDFLDGGTNKTPPKIVVNGDNSGNPTKGNSSAS